MEKIVVAHPYQQHSFRTAVAIDKTGLLDKYITTVYYRKGSLTKFFINILTGDNKKRAAGRKCNELSDDKIYQISEFSSLILLLLSRVDKRKKIYSCFNSFVLKRFNRKLALYLVRNKIDVVILYDTVCADCIKWLKKYNASTKVVIDMSAPNFIYMDEMFNNDIEINKSCSQELYSEMKTRSYKRKLDYSKVETASADYFLAASSLTQKSLQFSGIDSKRIIICRYGIDINGSYIPKEHTNKLSIVFIGDVTQKKGFHYFSRLIDELGNENFVYHVLGQYTEDNIWYDRLKNKCVFHGYVTHDVVINVCKKMDIIIFPSLADGFGLSVLDAMSNGVIPFVSSNAGVSDLIHQGENGFVFEPSDIDSILPEIRLLVCDNKKREEISKRAYETAKALKWDNYYQDIQNAMKYICSGSDVI